MRKLINICLITILLVMPQKISAKIGDIAGYTLYTDITAYINNHPVPSFNMNGNTIVSSKDLERYGFSVAWDETARTVSFSRNYGVQITPVHNVYKNAKLLGTPAKKVLETDIAAYIGGNYVESFNIDGYTAIYFDDLAAFGNVTWDSEKRAIFLTLPDLPSAEYLPVAETPDKAIALTFDDGPSEYTSKIIDTLIKYRSKATFFTVGFRIADYNKTILKMKDSGMEIGNHSYDHYVLSELSNNEITYQKDRVNEELFSITGLHAELFRPPCSIVDERILAYYDMPAILWSLDTCDWVSQNPDMIVETVMNKVCDGDIIIMHDLSQATQEAVSRLLPLLTEAGFKVTSVSELAKERGVSLKSRKIYYSFK